MPHPKMDLPDIDQEYQGTRNVREAKVHFNEDHNQSLILSPTSDMVYSSPSELSVESVIIDEDLNSNFSQDSIPARLESQSPISSSSETYGNIPKSPHKAAQMSGLGHSSDYDPARIPQSVFTPKSSNPTEWSMASNESLFSIQLGNFSYSRDHFSMVNKSGEIGLFPDSNNFPATPPWVSGLPFAVETKKEQAEKELERLSEVSQFTIESIGPGEFKVKKMLAIEEANASISVSHHSDGSNHSVRSFHFPQLSANGERGISVKMASHGKQSHYESEQSQHLEMKKKKAAASMGWFSCFSCCH